MQQTHLVWDWNGTLLDDLSFVIDAVNRSIGSFGLAPINADDYRDRYTRPVRHFYDGLFGRQVSDEEWHRLNDSFHETYFSLTNHVELTAGALEAIELLKEVGWTQSLLSMSPQEWLDGIVERFRLTDRFEIVDGLSGPTGGRKAAHLEEHLQLLGIDGRQVAIIGDTPDDVAAARHVGARAVLFHGGSHHLEVLEAEGVPIAETLPDAARIALNRQ